MKKIKTHLMFKPLSVFMAFLVLLVSCTGGSETLILNDNELSAMSGEIIFRNVLFKEGDLGSTLYTEEETDLLSKFSVKQLEEMEQIKNLIVEQINLDDPNYFENFKRTILSKDHVSILNGIINGRVMVQKQLQNILDISNNEIESLKIQKVKNYLSEGDLYGKEQCVAIVIVLFILKFLVIPVYEEAGVERSLLNDEMIVDKIIEYQSKK